MSLSQGRPYLAIPGPSVIPDRVLAAMMRPAPNIYQGELPDMMPGMVRDLTAVARTGHKVALYIANGHGGWEAALANVAAEGETVLVHATGRFGHGWGDTAERMGIRVERIDEGLRAPADPAKLEAALAADPEHRIRAVLVCQTDTATSALSDIAALRAAIDRAGHPALLMVDCIASLAVDRFEMDAWGVDVMLTGCQKGLMTPPGLCFVFFGAKAAEVRSRMPRVSSYWDWSSRSDPEWFYQFFCGTAPTHHLYGLRAALDMLMEEGMEAVWARHERLATAVWAAAEAWSAEGPLELNMADRAHRSRAVTTFRLKAPGGAELRRWVEGRIGLTLGIGLGMEEPDGVFRIGHMGHLNGHMILGALGGIEAGLTALGIPHGGGALDAAAEVISGA